MKKSMRIFMTERVLLPAILPKTGSVKTLNVTESIRQKLMIGIKEKESLNIKIDGNNVQWNKMLDKGIEIEWSKDEIELIFRSLLAASREEKLPNNKSFLDFYNSFIKDYEKEIGLIN